MRRKLNLGRLLTSRQVANRLNITQMTLLNWRRGSSLREGLVVRSDRPLGRARPRVRIEEAELVGWLTKHRPDLVRRWQQHSTN